MISTHLPSFIQTLVGGLAFYAIYYAYWALTTGADHRRIIREHGCQRPPRLPDWDPSGLGLGNLWKVVQWSKRREILEKGRQRFESLKVLTLETGFWGQKVKIVIHVK